MKTDNIVFAIAGVVFGLIAGWVIGTQQATLRTAPTAPAQASAAPASGESSRAALLDQAQVDALTSVAGRERTCGRRGGVHAGRGSR